MKFTIEQFTKPSIPELSIPDNLRALLIPKIEAKFEAGAEPIATFLQDGVVSRDAWIGLNQLANDGVRYLYINVNHWPIEYVSQLIEAINRGLPTTDARVAILERLRPQLPREASSIMVDIFPSVARPRVSKSVEVPKSFLSLQTDFKRDFARIALRIQFVNQMILETWIAEGGTTEFQGRKLFQLEEGELQDAEAAEKILIAQLEELVEQFVREGFGKTDDETLDQIFNDQFDLATDSGKIIQSVALKVMRKFYLTLRALQADKKRN